jgi:hypothetical protein
VAGGWVVHLFPQPWRRRYGDELLDILETRAVSLRDLVGLLYCALDAHLDPQVSAGGDFSFMEGRPSMRTRILAAAAVGGGLVILFGLIFAVEDGIVFRLATFYLLATLGVIGIHVRQASRAPVLAWIGFVPALVAYVFSLVAVVGPVVGATLPAIGGRNPGFVAQEAFWITSALFGAVTFAIGALPRPAALALTIGAPLAMIGMFIGNSGGPAQELAARIGVIAYGGSLIWLGLSGWTAQPRATAMNTA